MPGTSAGSNWGPPPGRIARVPQLLRRDSHDRGEISKSGADAGTPEIGAAGSSPAAPVAVSAAWSRSVSAGDGSERASSTVIKTIANIVFVGLVIYLTYFFTMFFSTRPPAPAPVSENVRAAAKKIEEQRAEERKLLTTYGPLNPVTKTVRIPIDRAMD